MRKRVWRLISVLVLLGWGALQTAVLPVSAHAVPVLTEPPANAIFDESPLEVRIRFNEPVVPSLSRITVLTQAGQAVETSVLRADDSENRILVVDLPTLSNGAYLVSWQVLSAVDGHTTSGSFSFGVGVAEITGVSEDVTVLAQLSVWSAVSRWLTLTGIALLIGFFTFRLFIWNPVFKGVELEAEEVRLDWQSARLGRKIGLGGLVLITIGIVITFLNQSSAYDLLSGNNFGTWIGTRFGSMWLLRFLLTAVFHFFFLLFFTLETESEADAKGRVGLQGSMWWLALLLGVGLACTSSLISHSAALTQDTLLATAVDLAHTLAASVWVGGLLYLAIALYQGRRLAAESRAWLSLSLILNFSGIAALSVGLLLVSGGYLGQQHVGGWTPLVGTAYGLLLLAKIGVALLAFAIAGYNLWVVKPRLQAAYEEEETAVAAPIMSRFGGLVRIEALLAFLILLTAGFLTDLQRAVEAPLLSDAPGRTVVAETADDLMVEVAIEPALVGQNNFDILLTDGDGNIITDAEEVTVRYTFLGQSIGAAEAEAISQNNGHYMIDGSYISLIGDWQLEVSVRRPGAFDTFVPFRLQAGLGGNIRPLTSNARPLEQFARIMTLLAGGGTGTFLVLFAFLWGFIAVRAAKSEVQLIPLLSVAIFCFWLGSNQLFTFFDKDFTPAKFTTNPILPDASSIAIGEGLYQENCTPCHGVDGRGDGPAAAALNPAPPDFAGGHTGTHPDGDLYYWILNGIDGSAMPAFEENFSKDETWHLVNYVRRLSVQVQE